MMYFDISDGLSQFIYELENKNHRNSVKAGHARKVKEKHT